MLSVLASAAATGGAKAAGGLPQLNPNDFAPQLIWLAAIFVLVYLLMSKSVLPKIGGVIDDRNQRIGKDLAEAQRLKGETEKALANYEQAMSEARAKAQKIAQDNRDTLNAEINRERAAVEARIAAQAAEAEKRIIDAKTRAMGNVADIATDTARAIVTRLINQDVSAAEAAQALPATRQS